MLHWTCTIQHVTSLRYIFRSLSLPLAVFLLFLVFLFLPLFSLVVGYNFFVCFFLPNVFGTVISGMSYTLANNWAILFCTGGGGGCTYLKTGAIRTFTVHVFHLIKKRPSSLSTIKCSCLISCYLRSVP